VEKIEERCYSTADGFLMARLLEERDQYVALAGPLGLAPILSAKAYQAKLEVRFRRPAGRPVSDLELSDGAVRDTILSHLCVLEEQLPLAPGHVRPADVFYDADSLSVVICRALLGWHALRPAEAMLSNWASVLSGGAFGHTEASSFSELSDELRIACVGGGGIREYWTRK